MRESMNVVESRAGHIRIPVCAFCLLLSGILVVGAMTSAASAADLKLKSDEISKVKKIEPKTKPKLEKVTPKPVKPKVVKPNKTTPKKTTAIKPTKPKKLDKQIAKPSKPKKLNKQITKPAPDKLKKLDVAPKGGGAPVQIKKAAIQQPGNTNQSLKKDLIKPSNKALVKDLEPGASDTGPLNADSAPGVVSSSATDLQIDPEANLSNQLVAPDVKDLVVKPQIKEGLNRDLKNNLKGNNAVGENLQGLAGDDIGSEGSGADIATSRDLVGNNLLQKGDLGRQSVMQQADGVIKSYRLCNSSGCGKAQDKADVLFNLGSTENPDDVSDRDIAEEVVGEGYFLQVITTAGDDIEYAWEDDPSENEPSEKTETYYENDDGEIPAPFESWVIGGDDGDEGSFNQKEGFAGLSYWEYEEDGEDDSSGADGSEQGSTGDGGSNDGSQNAEQDGSDDDIEYAWEDDDDTSGSEDGDGDADTSSDGGAGDTDTADSDGCPEGEEGCGSDGEEAAGDSGRSVAGGEPENPSGCDEGVNCDDQNPESEAGGDGTIRLGEEKGEGGPLAGGVDTSPANGTLRLANEEQVGGEPVRGSDALKPAADGTLRLPEGEEDEAGGTPQIAGGSGGGIGNPGVVTEGVASGGGVQVQQELNLQSGELNLDTESLGNVGEQVGQ